MIEVLLENNRWMIYNDGMKFPYSAKRIEEIWK